MITHTAKEACEWILREDASAAPITVNLSAEMDGVALGGLITRVLEDYKTKAMQAPEHLKEAMVEGGFVSDGAAILADPLKIAEGLLVQAESKKIEVTNTAAPYTIEQAKHIVDLAQELRFTLENQAMDSHIIEQIEIRKKRVADLRNELTSLGVAIPSDPSAAPAI